MSKGNVVDPDPCFLSHKDPLLFCTDPDPSINKQNSKKNLDTKKSMINLDFYIL